MKAAGNIDDIFLDQFMLIHKEKKNVQKNIAEKAPLEKI